MTPIKKKKKAFLQSHFPSKDFSWNFLDTLWWDSRHPKKAILSIGSVRSYQWLWVNTDICVCFKETFWCKRRLNWFNSFWQTCLLLWDRGTIWMCIVRVPLSCATQQHLKKFWVCSFSLTLVSRQRCCPAVQLSELSKSLLSAKLFQGVRKSQTHDHYQRRAFWLKLFTFHMEFLPSIRTAAAPTLLHVQAASNHHPLLLNGNTTDPTTFKRIVNHSQDSLLSS